MAKEAEFEVTGTVVEKLPGRKFRVELENGKKVLAYLSGRLSTNYIKIATGDSVTVAISPYDIERGRIVWRNR